MSDSDSDSIDLIDSFRDSFACLQKIKSNTPRARFNVYFYSEFIELIQFSVQRQVSNRYRVHKDDVREILRLPYSNDKHIFFVLHLKRPIVGGNRSTTEYDFVVFDFAQNDYEEVTLDKAITDVGDMFDDDVIEGPTVEVFETLVTKIFGKDVTSPAINYDGNNTAQALRCTFWDNDEHFLFPLDDGFVNVWKYCQKLKLNEVKNVRFVRSQGRSKTFDFFIYPKMERAIRRYHIGARQSNTINCFFLEFKAIDQDHYDSLLSYCNRNNITISTNDFRESASDTDSSNSTESESETPTELQGSELTDEDEQLIDDDYEVPDPHMVECQREGQESDERSGTSSEFTTTEDERVILTTSSEASEVDSSNTNTRQLRRKRSSNVITDEAGSSSNDSITGRSRKRSLRINSDDDEGKEIDTTVVKQKYSSIIDSDSD